jgi:hypothetical protein
MFLSSLVKTQSKSNALKNTNFATTSKSYINPFLKFQIKHVSRSLTSRENREKYDLKKMDDYWDSVDKEFERRMEIAKQIEEKYKSKSENLISNQKKSASETKEIYFVPLTKSDESILIGFFRAEMQDDIKKGGRLVLLDEVRKYNKSNIFARIEIDFEPLDAQDFEKIKKNFNYLLTEKEFFVVAMQQGKKIFEFLEAFKSHKANLHRNVNEAFRRVEHLEAIESSHPHKNNLNVNLRKIENSNWIKNLFSNNKIDEKILSEKFNKIYFEFLDCLNCLAAESRGFDIELFEDTVEHKKANETAKKEVKEKLNKVSSYLDSIEVVDGKVVESSEAEGQKKEQIKKGKEAVIKANSSNNNVKKENNNVENLSENNIVKIENNKKKEEDELESEEKEYLFDPEKDYSYALEKAQIDLTLDEYEYMRFIKDEVDKEEDALLKSSYAGRLRLKLKKAEEQLSNASHVLESNNASFVYATENLIKSQEIENIIGELEALRTNSKTNDKNKIKILNNPKKLNLLQKIDIENEENLLKLSENPRDFLQNFYWDLIKSAQANKDLKIPVSVKDKEAYVFNVLLKYFSDVVQSKNQEFSQKESRIEYFGENLKSYNWFDKTESPNDQKDLNFEEKANPENSFTPNFKKLVEYLNSKHGLFEKSVYDFKFNVESQSFKYPWNVANLSAFLPVSDGLGKEILGFYLENSNEKNLLSEKDQEKVFEYVKRHLAEMQTILQEKNPKKIKGIYFILNFKFFNIFLHFNSNFI